MRHLVNRRSNKALCEVSRPKVTGNITVVGQYLGLSVVADEERWCETCYSHYPEYDRVVIEPLRQTKSKLLKAIKGWS